MVRTDWEFRTATGGVSLRGGDLRVRRTPRSYLAGWYVTNVREPSRVRAALNVLGTALLASGLWQFVRRVLEGSTVGLETWVGAALVVMFCVLVPYRLYRDVLKAPVVSLQAVERAEVEPEDRSLVLHHGGEETELTLRTDQDVSRAREALRLRGVDVVDDDPAGGNGAAPAAERSGADDRGGEGTDDAETARPRESAVE